MRHEFDLPEGDREHLDARGLPWETLRVGEARWLLIYDYPIPPGYDQAKAVAALRIEPNYPDTQIDMVYFSPPLSRKDGKVPNNLSSEQIDGKSFQRWSRHRTGVNPWRAGLDDVANHLVLVNQWLEREFCK
jgi:hypothetical protein